VVAECDATLALGSETNGVGVSRGVDELETLRLILELLVVENVDAAACAVKANVAVRTPDDVKRAVDLIVCLVSNQTLLNP
jgi:hypothetical protein